MGVAADRYRDRLADHARQVDRARGELVAAAAAVTHLADTLEERQAAIKKAMHFVDDAIHAASRTVERLSAQAAHTALTSSEAVAKAGAEAILGHRVRLPQVGSPDWTSLADTIGKSMSWSR